MSLQAPIPDTLVILGACGSTRETYWLLKELSPHTQVVFVADDIADDAIEFPGESPPIVHDWDFAPVRQKLGGGDPNTFTQFVCGMGSPRIKKIMVERALNAGLTPGPTLISPAADVKPDAVVGRAGVIYPLSTLQSRARLGDFVTILIGRVGHDVVAGDFVTVATTSLAAGHVTLGEGVYLGMGALVREHLTLAPWAEAGMGAIVVRDIVKPGMIVVGNPARELRSTPVADLPPVSQEVE